MTTRELPRTTGVTAAATLTALTTVVRRMRARPLQVPGADKESWNGSPPAPRHVAALLHVISEEPISVSELAQRLGVSLATASQVVTDLEDKQLVDRVTDPADRRRTLVQMSATHRDLADALLQTRLGPVQRALDRMLPNDRLALVKGLDLLAAELENTTP